jgi:hypothetical protein
MKYQNKQSIEEHNNKLFGKFRKLNLPTTEYAIVSGGPLAIRNIKKTRDVDVIVTEKLWGKLKDKYEVIKAENKDIKVEVIKPIEDVDILRILSEMPGQPTFDEQLQQTETIGNLSFQNLNHCLWFKKHSNREKDKKDIELVKIYLKNHPEELKKIDLPL